MSSIRLDEVERWKDAWVDRAGQERTLRVRWLLNPDAEPRCNVQLTEQNGTVFDIRSLAEGETQNVLPVVLIPPLVNAHTHLEFSSLTKPLEPPLPFQDWIRSIMQWRQAVTTELSDSLRSGLKESRALGVRLIGEITTSDSELLHCPDDMSVVSFRESIGLRPERIEDQLHQAEKHLAAEHQPGVIRGLSPHAPYTVHPDLLRELMAIAVKHQAPVAMHLAETNDELELLTNGTGPFAEFLTDLGLFDSRTFPGGRSVLEFLEELAKAPKALAIHGNYFTDQEINFLVRHPNITTVYCPRTHSFFNHPPHPFLKLQAAGARVILGTDSRASNPDLNIWRELQHVARLAPELSTGQLLGMITSEAADAMGLNPNAFAIEPGGPFNPVMLSFDESLSEIGRIVQHPSTTPAPLFLR
jgi:cytosine/adenosine deaminase-related metal-dependent hydrolase